MSGSPGADQLEAQLRRATRLDLTTTSSPGSGVARFVSGTSERDLRAAVIAKATTPRRRATSSTLFDGSPRKSSARGRALRRRRRLRLYRQRSTLLAGRGRGTAHRRLSDLDRRGPAPGDDACRDDTYSAAEAALGDDFTPLAFAHLPGLLAVAEKGGAGDDPDFQATRPYLDALDYLIAGARIEDGLCRPDHRLARIA